MPRYHVQRSIEINLDSATVFDTIADYGTWTKLSPWLCAEPTANVTISSDGQSIGSVYAWQGEVVGHGEIEHKQLEPGRRIDDEIRFLKPFKSVSQVLFEIEPTTNGSKVTWHMIGSLPWFMFWMTSMMEAWIGMDYERGLKILKELLETGTILSETNVRGIQSVGPMRMAGVRASAHMSNVGPSMHAAVESATKLMQQNNLPTDGQMISVCHHLDMKKQILDFTSGFVIPAATGSLPSGLSEWSLPETKAFCVEHVGSYQNLGNAWSAANQHTRYKKLKQSKAGAFELYINNPENTAVEDLRTEIYLPLK